MKKYAKKHFKKQKGMKAMLNYNVKVGLFALRRDVTPRPGIFNWEKAEERGIAITNYIKENFKTEKISFCDTLEINERQIVYTEEDAVKAAEYFKSEGATCALIMACNFGNEEAAAIFAREFGKPVCIWAPLDESFLEDGMRYTDSQCGIFGISRILQRMNIPFMHILANHCACCN